MLKAINVLLTGAGAPGAPSIIKCLRKNGEREIRLVGVDMNEKSNGRRLVDVFYQVPAAKDEHYIDAVAEICEKEKIDVIMPLVTRELLKYAQHREFFAERGIVLSVDDSEILKIINNKANLLVKMRELGMETPAFQVVETADELEKAVYELGYPNNAVCVKGAEGNGSRGVRIIDPNKSLYDLFFNEKPTSMYISFRELMGVIREKESIPRMLVMEYLPGQEYGVDALCDRGRVLCMAGRYNYAVNSSIPQGCILEARDEPFAIASEIIEKLGVSGNINFDFIYDKNGRPRLIEINPRLSATIASYAPAGVNFPYLRIKQLLGEPLGELKLREGIMMQRRYTEVFFGADGSEIPW